MSASAQNLRTHEDTEANKIRKHRSEKQIRNSGELYINLKKGTQQPMGHGQGGTVARAAENRK